ncbi:MAG TPA: pirin family protein [Nitriliruptorales bacterium]|nr:pirin family protein [Nitriliruptorales bacterium]
MIRLRRDRDIHAEDGGWFHARWHFSFDRYRDPDHMGLGPLRVFNDDRLEPGAVWPLHPHRDVEGITYVVEGLFRHEDSLGNGGVLRPGGVQRMTLGAGAYHSEQNASEDEPMRFIQLWILPDRPSLPPEVEQRQYTEEQRTDRLLRVLGPHSDDVVMVHQDATVHVARLTPGTQVTHELDDGRGAYVYLIAGAGSFDDTDVATGDAAYVLDQPELRITAEDTSELILVDIPLQFEPVGVWAR